MGRAALTPAERDYIGRVKKLPCGVCGKPGPSHAHHPREGQGMGQRAGHFCVIPLCDDCHQGPNGIHGDRALWKIYRKTEMGVLNETIGAMQEESCSF